MITSRNFGNDSNHWTRKQFNVFSALPSDMKYEILSYLTKQECLTCMAVCHDWYNMIPQHAQHKWTELHLDAREIFRDQRRRNRCLSYHVKNVSLESSYGLTKEAHLYALMQRLLDWNCTGIRSLVLINWSMTDPGTFLNLLRQLSSRLTHLTLLRINSGILPTNILDACPALTHFTCQKTRFLSVKYDPKHVTPATAEASMERTTKITHLVLDAIIMDKRQIECILKRCPELRSFIGTSQGTWSNYLGTAYDYSVSVDLDLLFSWCPKIAFLATNFCCTSIDMLNDNPDDHISNQIGLRYLRTNDTHGSDQTIRCLTRNQQTLEFLTIHKSRIAWSPVLQTLKLPQLRTLSFNSLQGCTAASLVSLLNHCPALEILKLNCKLTEGPIMAQSSLNTMHRLRSLHWEVPVYQDGFSLYSTVEQCPILEKLVISLVGEYREPPTNFVGMRQLKQIELKKLAAAPRLFKYLARHSALEEIRFSQRRVQHETMRNIATIATLKVLDIPIEFRSFETTELVEFIQMLGNTEIESLTFRDHHYYSFSVLDAVAKLPLLTSFCTRSLFISYTTKMDKDGLRHLLRESRNLDTISIKDLTTIEENGKSITHDQVRELVLKSCTTSYGWDIHIPEGHHGQVLSNVTIKRVKPYA